MIFYSFFFWNEYANLRIKSIFVIWSPWGYNRLLYDKLPLNFSVVLRSKAMVVNDKISSFKNEWFRGLKYIASWCEIRKPLTSILEIYCLSSIWTVIISNFKFLKYTLYTNILRNSWCSKYNIVYFLHDISDLVILHCLACKLEENHINLSRIKGDAIFVIPVWCCFK